MEKKKEPLPAIEFHCRATDCVNNDKPFCRIYTMGTVIVLGSGGLCVRYEEKSKHEAA